MGGDDLWGWSSVSDRADCVNDHVCRDLAGVVHVNDPAVCTARKADGIRVVEDQALTGCEFGATTKWVLARRTVNA
jgi:hypothetical protein